MIPRSMQPMKSACRSLQRPSRSSRSSACRVDAGHTGPVLQVVLNCRLQFGVLFSCRRAPPDASNGGFPSKDNRQGAPRARLGAAIHANPGLDLAPSVDHDCRRRGVFPGFAFARSFSPAEFMPAADQGRSILAVELAPGATLQETDAATQEVVSILKARPEVASVYSALGTQTSLSFGPDKSRTSAGEVRKATVTINLVPRGQRTLSQQAFETSIGPERSGIPGERIGFGGDGSSGAKNRGFVV